MTSGKGIIQSKWGYTLKDTDLFQMALGIIPPWLVERSDFDPEQKRLDIYIEFRRGGEFTCHGRGREGVKAYDTVNKTWRHLNFFQHVTYLHARVPRTDCPVCGVGMDESKVLFATEGKDAKTVKAFAEDLEDHGGKAEHIQDACCDMSPAL